MQCIIDAKRKIFWFNVVDPLFYTWSRPLLSFENVLLVKTMIRSKSASLEAFVILIIVMLVLLEY